MLLMKKFETFNSMSKFEREKFFWANFLVEKRKWKFSVVLE